MKTISKACQLSGIPPVPPCADVISRLSLRREGEAIFLKGWPADPSQSIRLSAAMVSGAATRRVFLLVLLLAVSAMDLAEGEPQPRRRSKGSRCVSVTS